MALSTIDPGKSREPRTWRRRVGRAVFLYAIIPYLVVTVVFAVLQRRLMYRPTVADRLSVSAVGLGPDFGRDVELKTRDGQTIRGWLVSGNRLQSDVGSERLPLVLYFPGNSLNRNERLSDLREVAARGFDVLIFDYRGFGDSSGTPTEADLSNDALLVWKYATESLGYNENHVVIFGESLGGAVALSLWSKRTHRHHSQRR